MSYQLATAKIWDGSQWVPAAGGATSSFMWPQTFQRSGYVSVVSGDTPHVKGTWTEIISSAADNADMLMLSVSNAGNSTVTNGLIDVGIGASGAESVIVENANGGMIASAGSSVQIWRVDQVFPVSIAAGQRVAVRSQNFIASRAASVSISLFKTGIPYASSLITIGANVAASRGTNIPGDNVYVQLVASTLQAFKAIVMVPLGANATSMANEDSLYTLGIGASGSEIALGTMLVASSAAEYTAMSGFDMPFIYVGNIPQGSRLAVKQSIGRNYRDVILYGVPA